MARIEDNFLDCVVYLYPSVADAKAGRTQTQKKGGSGFIFAMPSTFYPKGGFLYVVTNRHVIEGGNTVIRLNTKNGVGDALETDEREWVFHPAGDDLACLPLSIDRRVYQLVAVKPENLLTKDFMKEHATGPGDEAFVIGRFINQEGIQKNTPTVRFGHISQMPIEPIASTVAGAAFGQESFIVECKSIGGFSGSPVFLWIPPMAHRPGRGISPDWHIRLLGVDWCHINDYIEARDETGKPLPYKLIGNTGMMGVVPAWKLEELLNVPSEIKRREDRDAELAKQNPPTFTLDSASAVNSAAVDSATDENPKHREGFNSLLNAAAQKQKPDGQTS
jgi:hypothetical protein